MKIILTALLMIIAVYGKGQDHKLIKLWETDSIIDLPESVLLNKEADVLYASQMGGNPDDKDGIGGLAKISTNGNVININWITGLNSPKGLGKFLGKIYAADLTDVAVIDINSESIEQIIPIQGAQFLNDITVDDKGVVYVSDSKTGRIHKIEKEIATVYLENIKGVNGLKSIGGDLYIAAGTAIMKANRKKALVKITQLPHGIDGIEPVGNGDFLYSSWGGYIYYGHKDGTYELLLDTHKEKKNAADIFYNPATHILYVPSFWKKTVAAYLLK